jgi:hypothetical protein
MNYYEWIVTAFGYIGILLMTARLPVAWYDSRIFLKAVRTAGYPRPVWFTFYHAFMPSVLGAPVILWARPGDFFRRSPADVLWDMAMYLLDEASDEEEETGVAVSNHADD